MELKHVEIFLAIVEHRSISKAAETLFMSQSTVSHRLSALERELGATLMLRGKGVPTVTLTPKGQSFVPIAQRWLSLYKDTNAFSLQDVVYPLRIASVDSINAYVLYKVYNAITEHENRVMLSVRTGQSDEIYDMLEKREIDVGFTYVPLNHNNFRSDPLLEQEMVLVERSARRRTESCVHPSSLNPADKVHVTMPSHITAWHDNWFDPAAKNHIWVDNSTMLRNSMSHEGCWSIAPILVAQFLAEDPDLHYYRFSPAPPNIVCYKATHRFPKPSTTEALEILERYLTHVPE